MSKIPLVKYIAVNNTEQALTLAKEYGLNPVTYQELFVSLAAIFKKFPEEAYHDFAMIHPDRQMIIDSLKNTTEEKENFSGADGGKIECTENKSGLVEPETEGTEAAQAKPKDTKFKFDLKENLPYVLVGAGILTGLVILTKSL